MELRILRERKDSKEHEVELEAILKVLKTSIERDERCESMESMEIFNELQDYFISLAEERISGMYFSTLISKAVMRLEDFVLIPGVSKEWKSKLLDNINEIDSSGYFYKTAFDPQIKSIVHKMRDVDIFASKDVISIDRDLPTAESEIENVASKAFSQLDSLNSSFSRLVNLNSTEGDEVSNKSSEHDHKLFALVYNSTRSNLRRVFQQHGWEDQTLDS